MATIRRSTSASTSAVAHQELVSAQALATAELQRVLGGAGHPAPGAAITLDRDGARVRAVVRIPPNVPWRIVDGAVARALRDVRALHPRLQVTDHRFEPVATAE